MWHGSVTFCVCFLQVYSSIIKLRTIGEPAVLQGLQNDPGGVHFGGITSGVTVIGRLYHKVPVRSCRLGWTSRSACSTDWLRQSLAKQLKHVRFFRDMLWEFHRVPWDTSNVVNVPVQLLGGRRRTECVWNDCSSVGGKCTEMREEYILCCGGVTYLSNLHIPLLGAFNTFKYYIRIRTSSLNLRIPRINQMYQMYQRAVKYFFDSSLPLLCTSLHHFVRVWLGPFLQDAQTTPLVVRTWDPGRPGEWPNYRAT